MEQREKTDSKEAENISPINYSCSIPTINNPSDQEFAAHIQALKVRILETGCSTIVRNIHHPSAKLFHEKILHSPQDVMQLLDQGLIPEYETERAPPAHFANNRSATEHLPIVRSKVAEWCNSGVCKKVLVKPRIVNPLSVATRFDSQTGEILFRVCADLSRTVNIHVRMDTVQLDDMKTILPR